MVDEDDELAREMMTLRTEFRNMIPRTKSRKSVVKNNRTKDDEHNEKSDKDHDEEITSPASCVPSILIGDADDADEQLTKSNTRQRAHSGNLRPLDNADDMQYLRRIHIICTGNSNIAKLSCHPRELRRSDIIILCVLSNLKKKKVTCLTFF